MTPTNDPTTSAPCWLVLENDIEATKLTLGCRSSLTSAVKLTRQNKRRQISFTKSKVCCVSEKKEFHRLFNIWNNWVEWVWTRKKNHIKGECVVKEGISNVLLQKAFIMFWPFLSLRVWSSCNSALTGSKSVLTAQNKFPYVGSSKGKSTS